MGKKAIFCIVAHTPSMKTIVVLAALVMMVAGKRHALAPNQYDADGLQELTEKVDKLSAQLELMMGSETGSSDPNKEITNVKVVEKAVTPEDWLTAVPNADQDGGGDTATTAADVAAASAAGGGLKSTTSLLASNVGEILSNINTIAQFGASQGSKAGNGHGAGKKENAPCEVWKATTIMGHPLGWRNNCQAGLKCMQCWGDYFYLLSRAGEHKMNKAFGRNVRLGYCYAPSASCAYVWSNSNEATQTRKP